MMRVPMLSRMKLQSRIELRSDEMGLLWTEYVRKNGAKRQKRPKKLPLQKTTHKSEMQEEGLCRPLTRFLSA